MEGQYYNRIVDDMLLQWKEDSGHKPLLLRGARQVGKSSAVRNLGKSFKYFAEVNFERQPQLKQLFTDDIDVKRTCSQLASLLGVPIEPGKTLLFIDEIQECIPAISSLRFFYEDYQQLHVIAAGSLLEFALSEIPSFGVGRIRSLYMYPFSFDEFLGAVGEKMLLDYKIGNADFSNPLPGPMHDKLKSLLRTFYLVGGMPEAVKTWVSTGDYSKCSMVHNDILDTYRDDFAKYKKRVSPTLISKVLHSVALQSGAKFVHSQVEKELKSYVIKDTLELLSLAGLITPVYHTSASGLPLGATINDKYIKYLSLDIGLMQTLLGLKPDSILISEDVDFVNKGALSEAFAGLEMMKYETSNRRPEMYYWQRQDRNAQAEVDYVIAIADKIIPVEVKANTRGSMQSLRIFVEEKKSTFAIRTCMENFSQFDNIKVVPLYALSHISRMTNS